MEEKIEVQTCYKHPNRSTLLRCNQCLKPICLDCAVSTPTGYRCKECIQAQQKRFNTSITRDYVIAAIISGVISLVGSLALLYIPLFSGFAAILLGPVLGMGIVNLVRRATQRRRSSTLNQVTVCAAGIGAALPIMRIVFMFLKSIFLGRFDVMLSGSLTIGWSVIFIALLCSTIWGNLKGINLRRP